jgi:hypothetical protein
MILFLSKRITVPAGTAKENALRFMYKVEPNIVQTVGLYFPAGCWQLAHARVWANEHPLLPSDADEDVAGEDVLISELVFYEFGSGDAYINIQLWNEDETNAHTISLYVNILEKKYVTPLDYVALNIQRFLELFRIR